MALSISQLANKVNPGSFASTIGGSSGTRQTSGLNLGSLGANVGGVTNNLLSQLGDKGVTTDIFAPAPRAGALPGRGVLPDGRGSLPPIGGSVGETRDSLTSQVPSTFVGYDGGVQAPRGSALPNAGQAPEGRAQPTVSTDVYQPLLDQVPATNPFTGEQRATDFSGNPVPWRDGLPNDGMVPEGRADPADTVTHGLTGTSPVITSTGSTYRQAGSPLMGSISYSNMPGEMVQSDIYSPLTGQPNPFAEPFTNLQTGQPTAPRAATPAPPGGSLSGLPAMPRGGGL